VLHLVLSQFALFRVMLIQKSISLASLMLSHVIRMGHPQRRTSMPCNNESMEITKKWLKTKHAVFLPTPPLSLRAKKFQAVVDNHEIKLEHRSISQEWKRDGDR